MNTKWLVQVGILAALLTGCTRQISRPTASATNLPFLTQTPSPTSSIPVELNACVATDEAVRIREGPGTDYDPIGALAPGACITILGRNSDSSWVYMETADGFAGWVAAWLLTIDGDLSKVSVQSGDNDTPTPEVQSVPLCTDVANLIDSNVTCKIETAYCAYLPDADGGTTLCTDKPYPNHFFQVTVPGEDWSDYNGQCIIVTGALESFFNGQEGLLQIVGHDRSQVSSCL
jgi:hypothetical protein